MENRPNLAVSSFMGFIKRVTTKDEFANTKDNFKQGNFPKKFAKCFIEYLNAKCEKKVLDEIRTLIGNLSDTVSHLSRDNAGFTFKLVEGAIYTDIRKLQEALQPICKERGNIDYSIAFFIMLALHTNKDKVGKVWSRSSTKTLESFPKKSFFKNEEYDIKKFDEIMSELNARLNNCMEEYPPLYKLFKEDLKAALNLPIDNTNLEKLINEINGDEKLLIKVIKILIDEANYKSLKFSQAQNLFAQIKNIITYYTKNNNIHSERELEKDSSYLFYSGSVKRIEKINDELSQNYSKKITEPFHNSTLEIIDIYLQAKAYNLLQSISRNSNISSNVNALSSAVIYLKLQGVPIEGKEMVLDFLKLKLNITIQNIQNNASISSHSKALEGLYSNICISLETLIDKIEIMMKFKKTITDLTSLFEEYDKQQCTIEEDYQKLLLEIEDFLNKIDKILSVNKNKI